MAMMPKGLIPKGHGQRLWRDLTSDYEFTNTELRLLENACFAADRIVKERRAIGDDYVSVGSQGQIVAHPLLPQLRADEAHLANMLKQLNIPSEDSPSEGSRAAKMREVATARWKKSFEG